MSVRIFILLFVIIIFTLSAFFLGIQIGKLKSKNEIASCPLFFSKTIEVLTLSGTELKDLPQCEPNSKIYDHCSYKPSTDNQFLHISFTDIPTTIFSFLHHPSSPAKANFIMVIVN